MTSRFVLLAFAIALVGCPSPSTPPDRSSPVLATAPHAIAANAFLVDTRDEDPLWASVDGSNHVVYDDRSGAVAPAIPMHESDLPRGLRGLAGGEIWVCIESGVAHFVSGAWTFLDWSMLGANAPFDCDGLDARGSTDVWVSGSGSLCHFDGTWTCRADLPGPSLALALTAAHAWLSHEIGAGAETELVVVDTSSITGAITTVGVGDLVAIGTITPVPGAEQVWLTHDPAAFMTGDASVRLFSTTALVRAEDAEQAVPIAADHAYLLQYLDSSATHCSGGITGSCGTDTLWSQLVVYEEMGTTRTEIAHFTNPNGAGVPHDAMLIDGHLTFVGSPTYVLP